MQKYEQSINRSNDEIVGRCLTCVLLSVLFCTTFIIATFSISSGIFSPDATSMVVLNNPKYEIMNNTIPSAYYQQEKVCKLCTQQSTIITCEHDQCTNGCIINTWYPTFPYPNATIVSSNTQFLSSADKLNTHNNKHKLNNYKLNNYNLRTSNYSTEGDTNNNKCSSQVICDKYTYYLCYNTYVRMYSNEKYKLECDLEGNSYNWNNTESYEITSQKYPIGNTFPEYHIKNRCMDKKQYNYFLRVTITCIVLAGFAIISAIICNIDIFLNIFAPKINMF